MTERPQDADVLDERLRQQFGFNVFRLRRIRGWTQQQLSDVSGVSRPAISEIENGVHVNATLRTAQRLAHALATPIQDLLSG